MNWLRNEIRKDVELYEDGILFPGGVEKWIYQDTVRTVVWAGIALLMLAASVYLSALRMGVLVLRYDEHGMHAGGLLLPVYRVLGEGAQAMSGVRPITDVWILGRPKIKYYGSFPVGFLPRARILLGATDTECVLHVCSGLVQQNDGRKVGGIPLRGFGPNDLTLDIDPQLKPTILLDVRRLGEAELMPAQWRVPTAGGGTKWYMRPWAILIDRPYTKEDAANYRCGADCFPSKLEQIVKDCLRIVQPGGRVGVLDYLWPRMGKGAQNVAAVAVGTGEGGRARWFTVWRQK